MTYAPKVDGFAHLTFPIHDLERAEQFYVGLLGATLVRRFDRETFLCFGPSGLTRRTPRIARCTWPSASTIHPSCTCFCSETA